MKKLLILLLLIPMVSFSQTWNCTLSSYRDVIFRDVKQIQVFERNGNFIYEKPYAMTETYFTNEKIYKIVKETDVYIYAISESEENDDNSFHVDSLVIQKESQYLAKSYVSVYGGETLKHDVFADGEESYECDVYEGKKIPPKSKQS